MLFIVCWERKGVEREGVERGGECEEAVEK